METENEIIKIKKEIEEITYYISTLKYEHQSELINEFNQKLKNLQYRLNELEQKPETENEENITKIEPLIIEKGFIGKGQSNYIQNLAEKENAIIINASDFENKEDFVKEIKRKSFEGRKILIIDDVAESKILLPEEPPYTLYNPYVSELKNELTNYDGYYNYGLTKKQKEEKAIPVQPRSTINRNDLCSCGSGLKYKKCCLNKK